MIGASGAARVRDLTPVIDAVRQAASLCREVQAHYLSHSDKTGQEPVTIADYGTQAIICRALMHHFPGDTVIAEESGAQFAQLVEPEQRAQIVALVSRILNIAVAEADLIEWLDYGQTALPGPHTWLIDPVDGTKGFLAFRHYVTAVALLEDGQATTAVIGAPEYPGSDGGALFYAESGAAYIQPMNGGVARRIHVSDRSDVTTLRALQSVEKSHVSHDRIGQVRVLAGIPDALVGWADSQEKYARIANGDAELYLRLNRTTSTRPHYVWDHAPGTVLVQAAGGRVSDLDGTPLDFSQGRALPNSGVIATNGVIHDQMVAAVQTILAAEDGA